MLCNWAALCKQRQHMVKDNSPPVQYIWDNNNTIFHCQKNKSQSQSYWTWQFFSHMSGTSFYFSYIFLAVAPWPCWQVKLYWLITRLGCVGITVVHPARGPWERHAVSFCQQLVLRECSTFCACVFVCAVPYFTPRRPLPKSTAQLPPSSFLCLGNTPLCSHDEVGLNFELYLIAPRNIPTVNLPFSRPNNNLHSI